MKRGLVLIAFLTSVLFSAEFVNPVKRVDEFEVLKKIPKVQQILKEDSYYKKALEYLKNPQFQKVVTYKDPETGKKRKMRTINFNAVLQNLALSVKRHKNPLAAKLGYNILLINDGRYDEKYKRYYPLFAKTMYAYGTCYGALTYGRVLQLGLWTKSDKKKALKVLESGADVCKKLGDWKFTDLMTRIMELKNGG